MRLFKFKEMSKHVRPFFKLENVELNFAGYENTLKEYAALDYGNLAQVFSVTKNLLLWADYLEELRCVVNTCVLKLDNRHAYLDAFVVLNKNNKKINEMIADTMNNKRMCQYYEKELLIQIKFLNSAYKYASREYNEHIHNGI